MAIENALLRLEKRIEVLEKEQRAYKIALARLIEAMRANIADASG